MSVMSVPGFLRAVSTGGVAALLAACATTADAPATTEIAAAFATPTEPVFVSADILGRRSESLDALLGEAALVRREGAGEFRRYSLARCSLIVILYPDENGAMVVDHLDAAAKSSEEEKPALETCLAGGLAHAGA